VIDVNPKKQRSRKLLPDSKGIGLFQKGQGRHFVFTSLVNLQAIISTANGLCLQSIAVVFSSAKPGSFSPHA